jgi:hypothetical protein
MISLFPEAGLPIKIKTWKMSPPIRHLHPLLAANAGVGLYSRE